MGPLLGVWMGERGNGMESLSPEERLALIERLWESLSRTPASVPTTAAQRAELDRRSAALDRALEKGQTPGVPWDEVLRQLQARR